mgnify:CR=1 FL=1
MSGMEDKDVAKAEDVEFSRKLADLRRFNPRDLDSTPECFDAIEDMLAMLWQKSGGAIGYPYK